MAHGRTLCPRNVALGATDHGRAYGRVALLVDKRGRCHNPPRGMSLHLAHPHLPHAGTFGSHVSVWLHQFELDRRLADGADPASSPDLRMRARVVAGPRSRRHLVAELESV